jgi:PKD repeat protein/Flp pilus assembly protein TadG
MFHPPKIRNRQRSRGQSLAEFAVVLPIILLLTLIALDFGRVYLGYINLQSMARIAANYAANEPDAWGATPDPIVQNKYKNQILADAAATNCALPKVGAVTMVPPPTFTDTNGDGIGLGDTVNVGITCRFGVITPFISNILGGSVAVSADSTFAVKSGLSTTGGGGGFAPNAAFSGNGEIASRTAPGSISGLAPFQVDFRDTSGGNPTSWAWDFRDGTTSIEQDPPLHTFTCAVSPCTYDVTMKATNLYGSTTARMTVTVSSSIVNFTADKTAGNEPLTVIFTNASTPGGTSYAWTFGTGEGTGTGTPVSHTYNSPGTYTVALTVTYPSPTGPLTATKVGFITVSAGCTVPALNGGAVRFNDAQGIWRGAPYNFTGTVIRGPGAPSGNFFITTQTLVAGSKAPCNSDVTVNRP